MNLERKPYSGNVATLKDVKVAGKDLVTRFDLDLEKGEEKTSRRFFAVKPTIDRLREMGAEKITILAHNGKGESLLNLRKPLEALLGEDVVFITSSLDNTKSKIGNTKVVLFENTRLISRDEEGKGRGFSEYLADMGEVYINDAFATSHRNHASTLGIAEIIASKAVGLQMEKEINELDYALSRSKDGLVAVIGGAKIKTKKPVIEFMSKIAKYVLVGGALPPEIEKEGIKLPDNVIVAQLDRNRKNRDITIESAEKFANILSGARTIIWNGAMGVFEEKETELGTRTIVNGMKLARDNGGYILSGGGETEGYIEQNGFGNIFNHISVGGGAMLEYATGKPVKVLEVFRK